MVKANDLFTSNHLKEMIRKYAANSDLFFSNGQVSEEELEKLVAKHISIKPEVKDGRACIKGTTIMVCDIVGDTVSLTAPVGFEKDLYRGVIPSEAIDAAYAFTMLHHDKVAKDRQLTYGFALPQDLYR